MSDTADQGQITELLIAHREGDPDAFEQLVPLVYEDLRKIAHRQLARHRRQDTLNTTALVHEAYLKLVDQTRIEVEDRDHFFAIAARAMRQIIIDFARKRTAAKRGGGKRPLSLDSVELSIAEQAEMLVAIDQALHKLSTLNERLIRVFECRYFAGLSEEETARALAVSVRTVQRDWMKGKALLRQELG
ncbi:MAG: ECF-type sigma factor [Thermoanaerobaculia bacterium]|nr:ECF-type sigma factor [Thermoanaerobaculia bacterium]